MKFLNSLQPVGLLILRLSLALIFFSHGYPKVARSAAGMQEFFVQHGLPGYFVYIAGVLEVFGAILLVLGVFTRAAALLLAVSSAQVQAGDCPDEGALVNLAVGTIGQEEERRLLDHIAGCDGCATALREMTAAADRVLYTPHIAGVAYEAARRLYTEAWENVHRALVGGLSPANQIS